jgi:hypothetical protein
VGEVELKEAKETIYEKVDLPLSSVPLLFYSSVYSVFSVVKFLFAVNTQYRKSCYGI